MVVQTAKLSNTVESVQVIHRKLIAESSLREKDEASSQGRSWQLRMTSDHKVVDLVTRVQLESS